MHDLGDCLAIEPDGGVCLPRSWNDLADTPRACRENRDRRIIRSWREFLNLGDNLRRLGKPRQAETKLQAAIRAWPKNKRAYDALAQLYMGMNRSDEAERMLLAAVRIDPYYGVGHANLAVLYTALHNPSQAVAHLDQAIRLGVRGPVIDKLSAQYR